MRPALDVGGRLDDPQQVCKTVIVAGGELLELKD